MWTRVGGVARRGAVLNDDIVKGQVDRTRTVEYVPRSGRVIDVFSLTSLQRLELPFRAHRISFHAVVFYQEGQGIHWVDGRAYHVSAGAVVSVARGQVHALPRAARATIVAFTSAALEMAQLLSGTLASSGVFSPWLQSPVSRLNMVEERVAYHIIESISEMFSDRGRGVEEEVLIHLFTAWVLLSNRYKAVRLSHKSPNFDIVLRFIELIEKTCHEIRDVTDYTRMLGVSSRSLRRACTDHLSRSPKCIIDEITIMQIKRSIVVDRATNKELTFEYAFQNQSALARYFRRHTGTSPTTWRDTFSDAWRHPE